MEPITLSKEQIVSVLKGIETEGVDPSTVAKLLFGCANGLSELSGDASDHFVNAVNEWYFGEGLG